jgi:phosphoenolpyruvate---glycerone phosphotransferase subunit DhaM
VTVGLVLVSHSVRLAEGAAELAREMAPDVVIRHGAGGPDGGLGTSLDVVEAALHAALVEAESVVVLADLGSAVLTVEMALEIDETLARRVLLASAPFVEGAVAAAVTAQQGAGAQAVLDAAEGAVATMGPRPVLEPVEVESPTEPAVSSAAAAPPVAAPVEPPSTTGVVSARVTIRNPLGLHARPAAVLARKAADLGVPMTIDGVNATSVLQLMGLGAAGGHELEVTATGEGADAAVKAVVELVETGFGEV